MSKKQATDQQMGGKNTKRAPGKMESGKKAAKDYGSAGGTTRRSTGKLHKIS